MNEFITGNLNTLEEAANLFDDLGRNSEAAGLNALHHELTLLAAASSAHTEPVRPCNEALTKERKEQLWSAWDEAEKSTETAIGKLAYFARLVSAPAQGADARPVADLPDFPPQDYYASDRAFWDAASMRKFAHAYSDRVLAFKFSDYEAFNEAARQVDEQARPFREMMGIATRDAAPSDAQDAAEVPWTTVRELAGKHGEGWSQYSGWAFFNDDKLFAFAKAIAAIAPREGT